MKKLFLLIIIFSLILNLCSCSSKSDEKTVLSSPNNVTSTSSPTLPPTTEIPSVKPTPTNVNLVEYTGEIPHIFFHCLIAYPELAYQGVNKGKLDKDCATVDEFKRCLEELYKNNYVLVDINSTFKEESNKVVRNKVMVPEGKKPIIMSIDDVNYDPKKMDWGMVDKIVLDSENNLATYKKFKDGKVDISKEKEVIPILESFIEKHPDFSINNSRATLAFTGWVGVLGYRFDKDSPNKVQELQDAKPVIAKLKEKGWTFGCHGYGHYDASKITDEKFISDTNRWLDEIAPNIGGTKIYYYPYGKIVQQNSAKYNFLVSKGFKVLCGVNDKTVWKDYGNTLFMTRQGIDGYSLRNYHSQLLPMFDTKVIFDNITRKP